ncbi:MAG TPA: N-acetylmuramoyl-L-alanine amidase [Phnomibacter sp.]|nr:N-acetylmuramoyl-L-alanine amidase [Phnomibacter sp.]
MLRITLLFLGLGFFSVGWGRGEGGNGPQKAPLHTIIIDPGHGGRDGGANGQLSREALLALEIGLQVRDLLKKEMPELNVLMTRETDILPGNLSNKDAALKWRAEFANQNSGDLFISIHLNASVANQRYGKKQVGTRQETYYVYSGKGKKRKKTAKTRTVPVYERYRLPATVKGTQTYILAADWYNIKVKSVGNKTDIYEGGEQLDSAGLASIEMDPVEARIRASQYTKYFFQKSLTFATYLEEEFGSVGRNSWGVLQRNWSGLWVLQATQMPAILIESGFIDNAEDETYLASKEGQAEMARCVVNAIKRYKSVLENPEKSVTPQVTAPNTGAQ